MNTLQNFKFSQLKNYSSMLKNAETIIIVS
jgi:hypothetical protein